MNLSPESRRAISRQYKETARPAGVFVIRNGLTGRIYVAGSLDVEGAMNRARFELNLHSHRNKALGRDWIAHGADRFTFEVIDRVKESEDPTFDRAAELEKLLALWREELQCDGEKGYNTPSAPAAEKACRKSTPRFLRFASTTHQTPEPFNG